MAWGIQNVNALVAVAELQNRRRDRNTALLFNFHPVGDRMTAVLFALHHTGFLNGAAVQQKLLGDGGLAGVRVRNNRKRAPVPNFLS